MNYLIGVDLGTTATKCVLFDQDNRVVKLANSPYDLYRDSTGMAEESFEAIFEAFLTGMTELSAEFTESDQLLAVSFTSQMHSLIAYDENWQALTRILTWADSRASHYAERLKKTELGQKIYTQTGTPIHAMSPLVKLLWLKNEQEAVFNEAAHFLDLKSALFQRLFGVNRMDLSLASGSGLWNTQTGVWDEAILDFVGISEAQLPDLVDIYSIEKGFVVDLPQALNFLEGVPFVYGGADGPFSNLGLGLVNNEAAALTIGTSGALRLTGPQVNVDAEMSLFSYQFDRAHWVSGGAVNSGGDVLRWLREQIFEEALTVETITALAEEVGVGAEGLLFLPYLGGERSPLWNSNARGSFFGLNYTHGRAQLARAVLEGVIFNLKLVLEKMEQNSGSIKKIKATGGFTNSELWLQITADIFEKEIEVQAVKEAGCYAAVIVAKKALGLIDTIEAGLGEETIGHKSYFPRPENQLAYRQLFEIFKSLSQKFEVEYQLISSFQSRLSSMTDKT